MNLAMLFVSTSGALGRYVDLPVPVTIATRGILAFIILYVYCRIKGISLLVGSSDGFMVILSGVLMCLHWLTYFYALQMSNVAIGMLSLFTYPVITAFLEPLILKSKFHRVHVLLGILVLFGVYFLSPEFDLGNSTTLAIGMGILSALCYALRNIILKSKTASYHGSMLMVYQTGIIGLLLFPALFFIDFRILLGQWEGIVALAVLTTAIGHTLFLLTFKHFSITSISIMSSIQPVFGIIIGAIFLGEIPAMTTLVGGMFILASVVIESVRASR
ncbi:DMT family transporter [Maribacter polysaccharolyticus]|uniref:DMT family transporter n=1 Tax=Maribacter polysaccharolyticus TaxID=3020831 RepID=UPI00237EFAAB|nr:DMT family transporter [Maribacter polysaccharolyticus]MDE3740607.1 DMT family transporter [Maribacter polysaccharolyticus]